MKRCWISELYLIEKLKLMKVQVVNKSKFDLPIYQTEGSAGMDVVSNEEHALHPQDRILVKTGLFMSIPVGYEVQVRPRSGLALKEGITVLNSPGTIDSDYRGEIGIVLINHGSEIFFIHEGDRIAQLILKKVDKIEWEEVESLEETERGSGGYGSTGK